MENFIVNAFATLYRFVTFLIITGTIATALCDIQKRAFRSKQIGLISMLSINQQLVGKR
jgi:hypothetical protein